MQYGDGTRQGTDLAYLWPPTKETYERTVWLLEFVEGILQKAGMPTEFVNVEPSTYEHQEDLVRNIRFNIRISGKDW